MELIKNSPVETIVKKSSLYKYFMENVFILRVKKINFSVEII